MKQITLICLLLLSMAAFAQKKDPNLPEGNEAFAEKKYADAEAEYRISQSRISKNAAASYNLGNAIYRQNHAEEAKAAYLKSIGNMKDRAQKHRAYHNLGNAFMKAKDYSNAVEAYKNA